MNKMSKARPLPLVWAVGKNPPVNFALIAPLGFQWGLCPFWTPPPNSFRALALRLFLRDLCVQYSAAGCVV